MSDCFKRPTKNVNIPSLT